MTPPATAESVQFLNEYSSTDARWDSNKRSADTVSSYYKNTRYSKYSERIDKCAQRLGAALQTDDQGSVRLKIRQVFLCHVRLCPVCQMARTRVWYQRFKKGIPLMVADHPKVRFIFLTLTVKNCAIAFLRPTLEMMSQAFTKLMKRRAVAKVVLGYARSMEVTKSEKGEAHPHFHVLIAVKSAYFGGSHYITQDDWATMWQESLGVDYKPVTHVTAVKPKQNGLTSLQTILDSVRETAKYMVKPSDMVGKGKMEDKNWLLELTKQIHGTKQMNLAGLFRKYITDEEPSEDDILKKNEDNDEEVEEEESMLFFNWFPSYKRYARRLE